MKTLIKSCLGILISMALLAYPNPAKADQTSREIKITQDLSRAGYQVEKIESKKIPVSNEQYFIVTASKSGIASTVKVFKNDKYYLSTEHGKLVPISIPSSRTTASDSKDTSRNILNRLSGSSKSSENTSRANKSVAYKDSSVTVRSSGGSSFLLSSAQNTVNLSSESAINSASVSFDNGCYQSSSASTASFGLGLKDTAAVLSHAISAQDIKLGANAEDPSKEFKKSKEDSATQQILSKAEADSKKDPVSVTQANLKEQINSSKMHQYTMSYVSDILKGKQPSGNLTPDQMAAISSLQKLAKSMINQGKSPQQVYYTLQRQFKTLYSGNVLLEGKDSSSQWKQTDNGKIVVYELTNNRDQVLKYAASALTLSNDPLYSSKKDELAKLSNQLQTLKKNVTFDSDYEKIDQIEGKMKTLSQEISKREGELLD